MSDYGPYFAIVRSIHDGDTIDLDIDLGFKHEILAKNVITNKQQFACRLFGINAPELSTDAGKASAQYLKMLLPIGSKVQVVSKSWDAYQGRYDAVVTKLNDIMSVNEHMVQTGHAVQAEYA